MKHFKFFLLTFALVLSPLLLGSVIAIYGDTRTNDEIHNRITNAIAAHHPEIAFHTGDLSSQGLEQSEYDLWKQLSAPLLEQCVIYPAKGNHEKDRDLYIKNFPFMEGSSYYTVEHDSLLFVMLDSTLDLRPGGTQYLWLKALLSAQKDLPILLFLHHPIFSSGAHGDELGLQLFLPGLLKDSRVIAVFSAHDHDYERSTYQGISYIVTGGGGAPFREKRRPNPYQMVFNQQHHYLIADKTAAGISFQVYNLDGESLDSFNLSR